MFKDLAKYVCRGNQSVICSRRFVACFEADLGTKPPCRKFVTLERALKDDL